jgi:predicted ATPase
MAKGAYVEAIRHFESGLATLGGLADAETRRRLELQLTSSLGTALIATSGYAAPRVGETFARASALCEELGEDPPLALLYGVWSVHLVRGDVEATTALLPRFRELADREGDDLTTLTVHAILGLRALLLGRLDEAEQDLDRAVAILGRPGSLEALAQMPYSGAVYPIAWRTVLCLYRGKPAEARASRDQLNEIAKRIGNPYGIAIAGHFSALLARDLGEAEEAQRLAEQQIAHSVEQKILLWQCSSACIRGWARALGGDAEGAAELATNVALLRAIGMRTTLPTLQGFLAEAQLATGEAEAARATAAEARSDCEAILDRYFVPELLRIEARCSLASGDADGARQKLREARALARQQGSPWFALLAAADLAELEADGAGAGTSRELLREALEAIEDGDGVPAVLRAREILAQGA